LISRKYPNGIVLSEGFANVGWHIHLMQATGWAMIVVFLHVYFALGFLSALQHRRIAPAFSWLSAMMGRHRRERFMRKPATHSRSSFALFWNSARTARSTGSPLNTPLSL